MGLIPFLSPISIVQQRNPTSIKMTRGQKKHLKRLNAPSHWMLDKLTGVYAPKPSQGPHKQRECLPLIIFLRNRLHYALTGDEVKKILMQRLVKVDGKVQTDENFRLIYDVKGRFAIHRITPEEARYKLCRVVRTGVAQKGVPYLVTHDARTIRYPNPDIKVNDSVILDIESGTITEHVKFDSGNLCMITGGHNLGRVGVIASRDRHPGSFDIVHVKDATGATFATRLSNVFIIGRGKQALVSLPRQKGIKISIAEEREKRLGR